MKDHEKNSRLAYCTGPICGYKKKEEREMVLTAGAYCDQCNKAASDQARGKKASSK